MTRPRRQRRGRVTRSRVGRGPCWSREARIDGAMEGRRKGGERVRVDPFLKLGERIHRLGATQRRSLIGVEGPTASQQATTANTFAIEGDDGLPPVASHLTRFPPLCPQ